MAQIQRMIDAGVERAPLADLPPRYQSRAIEDVLYIAVVVTIGTLELITPVLFDVGVFLLEPVNFNYANALPNKLFEFVQALRQNEMMEFKARLRGFDLLLVDDIQFIIGKASAQEELLYTIDALLAEGKRLVFAADRAPQALDGVEPRPGGAVLGPDQQRAAVLRRLPLRPEAGQVERGIHEPALHVRAHGERRAHRVATRCRG